MRLGDRLREVRKAHNLTLKDLSQRADLSVPYLSNIELGKVNPSVDMLQKLTSAYNMTVKSILTDVEGLGMSSDKTYPEGFEDLLEEYSNEIDEDWKDLLLGIALRGKRPSSKREWVELYLHLRRILDPGER
jgi:transcriptional regulator with XRE-family HTH domain